MRVSVLMVIVSLACDQSVSADDLEFKFQPATVTYSSGNDFIQSPTRQPSRSSVIQTTSFQQGEPEDGGDALPPGDGDLPAPPPPPGAPSAAASDDVEGVAPAAPSAPADGSEPFKEQSQPPFVHSSTNGFVWVGDCGGCGESYRFTMGCGEGCGCGEDCCWPCGDYICDERCNAITFYAGSIFLKREDPSNSVLFTNSTNTQRLRAGDYNFGVEAGIDAGMTVHDFFGNADLDVRVFNVDDWTDTVARNLIGAPTITNSSPAVPLVGSRSLQTSYSSELTNVEANIRKRIGCGCSWLTFVTGFRYMNINERYGARLTAIGGGAPAELVSVDTDNHFYGAQFGLDATVCGGCGYCVEAYARAGIFGNDSQVTSVRQTVGGGGASAAGSGDDTGMVGEWGVKAKYQLSDSINLFGRYQVLLIDGVAVATDQIPQTSFPTTGVNVRETSLFYHGATFGLEFVF